MILELSPELFTRIQMLKHSVIFEKTNFFSFQNKQKDKKKICAAEMHSFALKNQVRSTLKVHLHVRQKRSEFAFS
jgi:hypothetical protein